MVAVSSLASGAGSFEDRLYNAYISALIRLEQTDAPESLAEDLKWVLDFCRAHHPAQQQYMTEIPELQRGELVEKLMHLLIETSRMTAR